MSDSAFRFPLKMLRLPAVLQTNGNSRSTQYKQVDDGLMTPPISTGGRCVAWPAHEICAINAARLAGKSDDEIRSLVRELTSGRADTANAIIESSLKGCLDEKRHLGEVAYDDVGTNTAERGPRTVAGR